MASGFIERAGTLAATRDQDVQHAAPRPWRNSKKLFADRQAGDFGFTVREISGGLGKGDQGARDEAPDDAIGESGHGVRLHYDDGDGPQQSGHDRRAGDIAPMLNTADDSRTNFKQPSVVKGN